MEKLPTTGQGFEKILDDNLGLIKLIANKNRYNRYARKHKLDYNDILQLTRTATWLSVKKINKDIDSDQKPKYALGTYINMYTKHLLKAYYGSKEIITGDIGDESLYYIQVYDESLKHVDDADLLERLKKGLSEKEKQAIDYRYNQYMKLEDIAAKMDISIESARQLIIKASAKMKEKADEYV